jgi:rhodanese-related sulfurtransferase
MIIPIFYDGFYKKFRQAKGYKWVNFVIFLLWRCTKLTIILPEELDKKIQEKQKVTIIDVRAEEKFNDYHIKNSQNIPKTIILGSNKAVEESVSLPKDEEIIVTCTTGNSAAKCAAILREKGYKATVLEGGLTAWKHYLQMKEGDNNK